MGPIAALAHLIDFAAPAIGLALGLTLSAHLWLKKVAAAPAFKVQLVINASVCLAVLLAGLLLFGRDGKMLTYTAMAVACASSQWLLRRSWRA